MFDLVLLAKENATTPERQALLDGLLEDSAGTVMRVMEESEDHAHLLEDEFFSPLMALATCVGSSSFWQAMGNWGYDFNSSIAIGDPDLGNTLDIGSWAARFVDFDRLGYLIEEGVFKPFSPGQSGGLSAGEAGMLSTDDARFGFWVEQWKRHARRGIDKAPTGAAPNVPRVLGVMREMHQAGVCAHEAWPDPVTLGNRISVFMDAFLETFYGATGGDVQWNAFLHSPPTSRHCRIVAMLTVHAANKATNAFADTAAFENALARRKIGVAAGLIQAGAPLAFTGRHSKDFPALLLEMVSSDQNVEANVLWSAWIERAQAENSPVLPTLPAYLKRATGDYQQWLSQDPDRAQRTIDALAMSARSGPAQGPSRSARL